MDLTAASRRGPWNFEGRGRQAGHDVTVGAHAPGGHRGVRTRRPV